MRGGSIKDFENGRDLSSNSDVFEITWDISSGFMFLYSQSFEDMKEALKVEFEAESFKAYLNLGLKSGLSS